MVYIYIVQPSKIYFRRVQLHDDKGKGMLIDIVVEKEQIFNLSLSFGCNDGYLRQKFFLVLITFAWDVL